MVRKAPTIKQNITYQSLIHHHFSHGVRKTVMEMSIVSTEDSIIDQNMKEVTPPAMYR